VPPVYCWDLQKVEVGRVLVCWATGLKADREAAFSVFKFLMKMLGTDVGKGSKGKLKNVQ